ncbi:MAG: hypothetical protein ACR2P3_02740, partial [Geminicoccaceae bacterium]
MKSDPFAPNPGRALGACALSVTLLAFSACSGDPEPVEVVSPPAADETIRSALGKITLDATAEGQEVLGVQLAEGRGVINLHYAGPAANYVVCDSAEWLVAEGGVVNVDLSENAAFETIDDKGNPVSMERWVRLDALTNV